jgi:hypothetical protein
MSRLAGAVDGVIGVDPHRDTLAAAAIDVVGGLLAQTSVSADAVGYRRLLDFALAQVPGPALLGGGGCRQLRRWAGGLPAGERRAGGGGGPAQSGRRGARGPRATPWTPSAPPGKPSPRIIRWHPVVAATGQRCGSCWRPATALALPRSAPRTS